MQFLLNFIKGLFIGAGAILPGISSGVICIILGIYEKLLNSILNFFKDIKNNMKDQFLKRILRISKSTNIIVWTTLFIVGISTLVFVIFCYDIEYNNKNLFNYLLNISIISLVVMLAFIIVLTLVSLIFSIVNRSIKKYLSNKKKSQ